MESDAATYVETKRTLDGRVQRFPVRLLVRTPGFAAVRFDFAGTAPVVVSGFSVPPGSSSIGFYWRGRSYNLYHIVRADGTPVADRFDVVEKVRIGRAGVEFTDLLLDFWVSPLGEARFEDEDEVKEAHGLGVISDAQRDLILRAGHLLARNHRRLIAGALAQLRVSGVGGRVSAREARCSPRGPSSRGETLSPTPDLRPPTPNPLH